MKLILRADVRSVLSTAHVKVPSGNIGGERGGGHAWRVPGGAVGAWAEGGRPDGERFWNLLPPRGRWSDLPQRGRFL